MAITTLQKLIVLAVGVVLILASLAAMILYKANEAQYAGLEEWHQVAIGDDYDRIVKIYGTEADDIRERGDWKIVSFFWKENKRTAEIAAEAKAKNEPYQFWGLSTYLLDENGMVVAKYNDGDVGSFESFEGVEHFLVEAVTVEQIEALKRRIAEDKSRGSSESL